MKFCTKCQTSKPYSEFGKKKETKDGYRYCCRLCAAKHETEKRRTDPEARRKANAAAKRYRENMKLSPSYAAYLEKGRAMCRNYYHAHLEESRNAAKDWRENNRGLKRLSNTMRKKGIKQRTPAWANLQDIN
jgi:hypothetical protein